mmetsp:Transcript_69788/g.166556  ORF Transcript_69788/g.166556 Transcript_69788/m.166556 type:complete len:220 (+) Transcript_69788:1184-1843(+)
MAEEAVFGDLLQEFPHVEVADIFRNIRSELPLHGLMKVDVNCVLVQLAAVLDRCHGTSMHSSSPRIAECLQPLRHPLHSFREHCEDGFKAQARNAGPGVTPVESTALGIAVPKAYSHDQKYRALFPASCREHVKRHQPTLCFIPVLGNEMGHTDLARAAVVERRLCQSSIYPRQLHGIVCVRVCTSVVFDFVPTLEPHHLVHYPPIFDDQIKKVQIDSI